MVKLIRVFNDNFRFKLDFYKGSYNLILFSDENIRFNLINYVYRLCQENYYNKLYFISGFNLKPYLNLSENIYDKFGIDMEIDFQKRAKLKHYCKLLNFKKLNSNFDLLSNLNKLKSVFIVALFSKNKIILFNNIYSSEFGRYVNYILRLISKFNLFSDKVFILIKKQVLV